MVVDIRCVDEKITLDGPANQVQSSINHKNNLLITPNNTIVVNIQVNKSRCVVERAVDAWLRGLVCYINIYLSRLEI